MPEKRPRRADSVRLEDEMGSDAHLDGKVMGGLLMEMFGQEMTDAPG